MSKVATRYLMLTALLVVVAVALIGCGGSVSPSGRSSAGYAGNLRLAQNISGESCEPQVFTLWAGQTIPVGTITVSNVDENLYVNYETTGDWWLTEVQLYVLEEEPTSRLVPGLAPYKSGDISYTKDYEFVVPKSDLEWVDCGETLWLQAHAAVVKIVDDEVVQDETAYGGEITRPRRGAWYGNIEYVWCCEDNGNGECEEETAWGGDTVGGGAAWWYYYDASVGGVQTLWAGQTIDVGTVEAVDGTVYIILTGDWELQNDDEAVKIQGYNEVPTSRPAAGGFAYKGTDLTVPVGEYAYYAIHLDVQLCPED